MTHVCEGVKSVCCCCAFLGPVWLLQFPLLYNLCLSNNHSSKEKWKLHEAVKTSTSYKAASSTRYLKIVANVSGETAQISTTLLSDEGIATMK